MDHLFSFPEKAAAGIASAILFGVAAWVFLSFSEELAKLGEWATVTQIEKRLQTPRLYRLAGWGFAMIACTCLLVGIFLGLAG